MQSNGIIKDLYINFVGASEHPHKYYLLFERVDTNTKQLKRIINKKNKRKLEKLCDDYEEIISIESDEAFIDGFSFAVQLLSEAYSRNK